MTITFRNLWRLPFHQNHSIDCRIDSENQIQALNVINDKKLPDFSGEHTSQIPAVLACLNGEIEGIANPENVWYDEKECIIYLYGHPFLKVRAWGYLTGYLELDYDEACEIQKEFGEWVVEKLTKHGI